jgi:peptidoglycan lytic transglycosylase A
VDPPAIEDDLSRESLVAAIDQDLRAGGRLDVLDCPATKFADALRALHAAALQPASDLSAIVRSTFDFYRSTGREGGALFTAYYEPILEGRRRRVGTFTYPLYRRPDDLVTVPLGDFSAAWSGLTLYGRVENGKLVPYYSRRQIDGEQALGGRGLELVWLDDPVGRYFLQVQGSGVVRLGDGSSVHLGFAGSNGLPYESIGRLLAESGALGGQAPTAPAIQEYLRSHPDERDATLFRNPRYVFFRETPDGPLGTLGVTLTAGRSIAVDPAHYPLGALAYVVTEPRGEVGPEGPTSRPPVRRLVLVQDTGAAISGPGRVDLFLGSGPEAGREAGSLSARGDLYLLAPHGCR